MDTKDGNLIMSRKVGESIKIDGPAIVLIKKISSKRVIVMIKPSESTNVKRLSKEVTNEHLGTD